MFGSHLSVAGGMVNAITAAADLRFDTVQVFTKNQRQWRVPALKDSDVREWKDALASRGWSQRTVSHATYLMNLASPDEALRAKSAGMMAEELERCAALSIPYLVAHPGAHLGEGVDAGLRRIARALSPIFRRKVGAPVMLCLENTAGGGSTLGRSFEELATLRELIDQESAGDSAGRIGFCFDTCHALAAGYDLASHATDGPRPRKRTREQEQAAASAVFAQFDRACGLANLRVLHLNDSKGALGSHIDRHEHIGKGKVSLGAFGVIVNHPELADRPKILETPKEDDPKGRPWDSVNLACLKRLISGPAADVPTVRSAATGRKLSGRARGKPRPTP